MEILELTGDIDFHALAGLVIAEWPAEFGERPDEEKIGEIAKIADPSTDINKILVDGGRIIGWYRYSRWPRAGDNADKAHTLDIVVLPEYKGRGLGALLMRDLIADCRRRGYRNLKSRTFFGNEPSIRLHRRTGFREAFRTNDSIVWEADL